MAMDAQFKDCNLKLREPVDESTRPQLNSISSKVQK